METDGIKNVTFPFFDEYHKMETLHLLQNSSQGAENVAMLFEFCQQMTWQQAEPSLRALKHILIFL